MTVVLSCFPGTGKSYATAHGSFVCHDSDSSDFHFEEGLGGHTVKPDWPSNYVEHVRSLVAGEKYDFVFVSSHLETRSALVDDPGYALVLPLPDSKTEYLERYSRRGSSKAFVDGMVSNWEAFNDHSFEDEHGVRVYYVDKLDDDTLTSILREEWTTC